MPESFDFAEGNIRRLVYYEPTEEAAGILVAVFASDAVYSYDGVAPEVWERLSVDANHGSIGKSFNLWVRSKPYRYTRLQGDQAQAFLEPLGHPTISDHRVEREARNARARASSPGRRPRDQRRRTSK